MTFELLKAPVCWQAKPGFVVVGTLLLGLSCDPGASSETEAIHFESIEQALSALIADERATFDIPAISIALIDGEETTWAAGFGHQDLAGEIPASASTVYRIGSVSKLFTDIAVMQLVEEGRIDLDAPITELLPSFLPVNPSQTSITLRQMMSHRSGLVREPPTGHYFDDTGTTLAQTVESLSTSTLVYPPESKTKYSNAAIATVGYTLEVLAGEPFAEVLQRAVLDPMGLTQSAFLPRADLMESLAEAQMWTYHNLRSPAPTFQLGMAPAGSMYSSVEEMGKFVSWMLRVAGGEGDDVLSQASLEEMWTPQGEGAQAGFGLGFSLSEVQGHRSVGHGGAIYGFSTQLQVLPDEGLGVAVAASLDVSNTVTNRIARVALELMLAKQAGEPITLPPRPAAVGIVLSKLLDGVYGEGDQAVRLRERNGALRMSTAAGGVWMNMGLEEAGVLVADDVHAAGTRIRYAADGAWLEVEGVRLMKGPDQLPAPPTERLMELVGEYGWDHNVLYVYEDDGRLRALIEWVFDSPLDDHGSDTFSFPDRGLYPGEDLVFQRGPSGVEGVSVGGVWFERRAVGTEEGETFRIDPVRPVEELRVIAREASPAIEDGDFRDPDLLEVAVLDPTIMLDIRYASTDNFMGAVFYSEPRAFLQRPAAEAVVRAHRALSTYGLGILIHDGYRPWFVTKMFWDATPEEQRTFVANPANGSRHNRGAAVDLTLYELSSGRPVRTVGGYDEFSPRSYPEYPGGTARQRWYRELLRDVMEAEGFTVYEAEWWHFDYGDWRLYSIQNMEFDELSP